LPLLLPPCQRCHIDAPPLRAHAAVFDAIIFDDADTPPFCLRAICAIDAAFTLLTPYAPPLCHDADAIADAADAFDADYAMTLPAAAAAAAARHGAIRAASARV